MLSALTVLMILVSVTRAFKLRLDWRQLSRRTKSALLSASGLLVAVYVSMLATGWATHSALVNVIVGSLAVGAYSLVVLLLTLFRPKLLFAGVALLLLLPVAAAFVVLPLSAYSQGQIKTEHVAGTLFVEKIPWDEGALGSSGTTLLIYETPRFVPFIRHNLVTVVFDDSNCVSTEAFAVLQPDLRHVLARCPWYEYQQKEGFHEFLVPIF
jgi:hypothetical protein